MIRRIFIDQLGNQVYVPVRTERIVSLVPSQTELLADLRLGDRVVGITKFCIRPTAWRKTKTIVGGTKNFDFRTIQSLKPDLILGNKEENYREGIEALQKDYPVWMSDIVTLGDALNMIVQVGAITDSEKHAEILEDAIRKSFRQLQTLPPVRALYLIWKNPWMAVASGTFIHTMMELSGFQNCLAHQSRYPEITSNTIVDLNPGVILLSSEPYPFREKHVAALKDLCPDAKILLADGEMFSWYGSRLLEFAGYINELRTKL